MKILFVSAEVSPYAKVGGLADVAGSLPKELLKQGHDVRVVMPLYAMIEDDSRWELETVAENEPVQINSTWLELATIKRGYMDTVPIYFIGHSRYFRSATSSESIYTPGIEQYLFFSAAVLELAEALGWTPDVVHCNDWHTGFIPVLMRERFATTYLSSAAVFTIHNLAFQGEFGIEILDALNLPRSLFIPEKLETWGGVNFLKSGCVYSDQVNTVSPTYAKEIQAPEFGCKLEGLMKHLAAHGRLTGILNGIDTAYFDPASDPHLAAHYSAAKPEGKARCREALLQLAGLKPIKGAPVVGAVTRLSWQKGLHLLAEAAPALFQLPIQLVVQGLGDPALAETFRALEKKYPKHLRIFEVFDEDLAHTIYAGSDMFAMPSLFEPCGLGQMIALRYGTVPVVRNTGGLADTVRDGDNGFVFETPTPDSLVAACSRAVAAYRKASWHDAVTRGLTGDYGWDKSAREYVKLYERAAPKRQRARRTA